MPLFTKQQNWYPLKHCEGNFRPGGKYGSIQPGLWLTSPTGCLQRTGISTRTLCSVIEYELPFLASNPTVKQVYWLLDSKAEMQAGCTGTAPSKSILVYAWWNRHMERRKNRHQTNALLISTMEAASVTINKLPCWSKQHQQAIL